MKDSIQYIRELQSKFPSQTSQDIARLLKYRKKQLNITDRNIKKFSKEINKSSFLKYSEKIYNNSIAKPFLSVLPKEVRERLKDVYIGLLPTYKINASTFIGPNGKPIIVLHNQLLAAIHHYNETQMIFGKKSKKNELEAIDFLIKSYSEISKCFVYSELLPKMSLLPPILSIRECAYMNQKTFLQELFIIAHEYAHIYLGHLNETEIKNVLNDDTEIKECIRSQKMELDADLQATKWIIIASKKINITKLPHFKLLIKPSLAVEIFMLLHMLEVNSSRYINIISDINKDLTYEEYSLRIINVAKELSDLLNEDCIYDNYDHPKAIVRLTNLCVNAKDLLNKEEYKFLNHMSINAAHYESFKFKSLF